MPIAVTCQCGKRVVAKDHLAGKAVKCPGCGHALLIPQQRSVSQPPVNKSVSPANAVAARKPKAEPAKSEEQDIDNGTDEASPRSPQKEKRKKLKKKKKKSGGPVLPVFTLLGVEITVVKLIVLLIVAGVVGGFVWMVWPSSTVRILEQRRVDVFSAGDVRFPNILEITRTVAGSSGEQIPLRGGDRHLLVVRDSPEGEWLVLKVRIPPKVIDETAKIIAGTVDISHQDFKLQGESQTHQPLFLKGEYTDPARGADVLIPTFGGPIMPAMRPPWTHEGTIEGLDSIQPVVKDERPAAKKEEDENRPDPNLGKPDPSVEWTGAASFKGKRGMEVRYQYKGNIVHVSWDAASRGWVDVGNLDILQSTVMLESLDIVMIFPYRPGSGEYKLMFFDRVLGTVNMP